MIKLLDFMEISETSIHISVLVPGSIVYLNILTENNEQRNSVENIAFCHFVKSSNRHTTE